MSLDNIAPENVCYVHCNFCSTNLAVNVPSNMMLNAVTVKCGHCGNLLYLNTSSLPQTTHNVHKENLYFQDLSEGSQSSNCSNASGSESHSSENYQTKMLSVNGGAMGKRQRPPSAYNRFIKEEIRRIKANNPKISHREAFSTAAKNWAHLPNSHFGLTLNASTQDTHQRGA